MRLARELTCQEVVELVTAYLDGALARRDRKRFEKHLALCDGCSMYLEQIRETVATTQRVSLQLPADLEQKLLEAFRGWRASGHA
jgi:anti-sigma factor RsiW